jgi:hypothetical protein
VELGSSGAPATVKPPLGGHQPYATLPATGCPSSSVDAVQPEVDSW